MAFSATTKRSPHALAWDHTGRPVLFFDAPPDRAEPVDFGVTMASTVPLRLGRWTVDPLGWRSSWGRLAHLGVHAYQRAVAPGVREVVAQIDSATTDLKTFGGALYFEGLKFVFPDGWLVLEPKRPRASGTQFFPALASLTRRFVLYRNPTDSALAQDALAMRHLKPPAEFPRFGPSQTTIPLRVKPARLQALLSALELGNRDPDEENGAGFYTRNLGEWHPASDPQAGAVAGAGIYPFPRLGDPLRHSERAHTLAERNRIGGYSARDGAVIEAHEYAPQDYRLYRGETWNQKLNIYSGGTVNDKWTERRANSGTCEYEPQIRNRQDEQGYSAFDVAHMVRGYLDDVAAYYLAACPLHRLRVQLFAQDVMASERRELTGAPDQAWHYSLAQRIRDAERNPHKGGDILRSEGWKMHVVAHAIAITPPSPTRDRMLAWSRDCLKLQRTISPPSGIPKLGSAGANDDSGIPWNDKGLARNKQEAPCFQMGIYIAGLHELACAAGEDVSDIIKRSCDSVFFGPLKFVKSEYNDVSVGPPWYICTGVDFVPANPIAEGVGLSHTMHLRDWLSRAYAVTKEAKYLEAACRVDFPQPSIAALKAAVSGTDYPWDYKLRAVLESAVAK